MAGRRARLPTPRARPTDAMGSAASEAPTKRIHPIRRAVAQALNGSLARISEEGHHVPQPCP